MTTRPIAQLRRVLTFRDLLLFYIVTSFSLRWVATAAAAGPSALVIWVIAALGLYVPLVFTVLELSSRYPEEGGVYVWSKRAFGPFAAFITGWTYWGSNLPYLPGLLYFAAANALFIGGVYLLVKFGVISGKSKSKSEGNTTSESEAPTTDAKKPDFWERI